MELDIKTSQSARKRRIQTFYADKEASHCENDCICDTNARIADQRLQIERVRLIFQAFGRQEDCSVPK